MDVRIYIDRNQYTVEIKHNNNKIIRYTKIPDSFKGGEYIIMEQTSDKLVYKISPLYEILTTENGYIHNFNIKLTNWLNYFIYKSIKSARDNSEFVLRKEPKDLSKELKEYTEVILNNVSHIE